MPGPHLLHSQEDYQSQGSRKDQVRAVQCVVGRGLARSVVLLHSHACMQRCICDDVEEAGVLYPHGNDMVPLLSNTPSPSAQYVAVLGYDIVWALGIGHQLV